MVTVRTLIDFTFIALSSGKALQSYNWRNSTVQKQIEQNTVLHCLFSVGHGTKLLNLLNANINVVADGRFFSWNCYLTETWFSNT